MLRADRGDFIDYDPYADSPQSIDYGVTISAPHMHAYCLVSTFGLSLILVRNGSKINYNREQRSLMWARVVATYARHFTSS